MILSVERNTSGYKFTVGHEQKSIFELRADQRGPMLCLGQQCGGQMSFHRRKLFVQQCKAFHIADETVIFLLHSVPGHLWSAKPSSQYK